MTFFTALPSSARCTPSSATAAFSIVAGIGVAFDDEIRALLAVHLHRQTHHIFDDQAVVRNGPWRLGDQSRVTEPRPAFLRQMRHHRRK